MSHSKLSSEPGVNTDTVPSMFRTIKYEKQTMFKKSSKPDDFR